MKRLFKHFTLAAVCLAVLLLFSGCADKATLTETVLTIDESFAGSRVMTFSIEEGTALEMSQLTKALRDNLPSTLEMSGPVSDNGVSNYTFTLTFSSMNDYKTKVASLLASGAGISPVVNYVPPTEDLFTSGFTLNENFTSGDLFTWAVNVAKEQGGSMRIVTKNSVTTVKMGDKSFLSSDVRVNISSEFTPLDRVIVTTERFSDSEYKRTFEVVIGETSLDRIGRNTLTEKLLAPLTEGVDDSMLDLTPGFVRNEDGSYSYYIISARLTPEQIGELTAAVLPGSTFEYSDNEESGNNAFTVSGVIRENLVFTPFVCNTDRSANIKVVYSSSDNTYFENGDNQIFYERDKVTEYPLDVTCRTVYELSSILIESGLSISGKAHVYITCEYADESSSQAAAERAVSYLEPQYAGLKVYALAEEGDFVTSSTGIGHYALRMETEGTPAEITASLQEAFGDGNLFEISSIENFRPLNTSNIHHVVDITSLTDAAVYSGNIDYKFTGTLLTAKNVQLIINEAVYSNDILGGTKNRGGFNKTGIGSSAFTLNYQYEQINLMFVLVVLLGGAVALGLVGLISRSAAKALSRRDKGKKADNKAEAVKSVALALIPEDQRGELAELPSELANRPTVMLEPHYDDGLDEDGDEPEGVWLFSTMMRLFAVIAGVLFFFRYFKIGSNSLFDNSDSLSGLKIFLGTEVFGQHVDGYPLAVLFIVIPIVIIVLLSMRQALPKLIAPAVCFGLSAAQIYLLLGLPDVIDAKIDLVQSAVSKYVSNPTAEMGYECSLVIYILLAIGSALLIAAELIGLVTTKPKN